MTALKTHRLHVLITDAEQAEVALAAHQLGVSVGAFTRACLEAGLRDPKRLTFKPTGRQRQRVKAPFMDPYNPESGIHALQHKIPPWAQALFDAGWTKHELHYRNHAAALAARGQEPLYDAVARYKQLAAEVLGH